MTVSTMDSLARHGLVTEGPHYDFNKPFIEDPPGQLKPIRYEEINTYREEGVRIIWIPRYSRRWAFTTQGLVTTQGLAAGPRGPGKPPPRGRGSPRGTGQTPPRGPGKPPPE